jgi:hypothetical protein
MSFFDFSDFKIEGGFSESPLTSYDPLVLPEVPHYTLAPLPEYGGITMPASLTAPDSPGWFSAGNIGGWFSDAGSSLASTTKSVTDTLGGWFTSPSTSNQSVMQATAGAASTSTSLFNTVSSWFKGTTSAPSQNKATTGTTQSGTAQALGVVGALKALVGVGPAPAGSKTITQAMGEGVGNIISPLKSTILLMLVGLVVFWLILGRLQRVG